MTATTDRAALAHGTLVALESEIERRLRYRTWYREHRWHLPWADFERENTAILRTLLRLRGNTRRMLRGLPGIPWAITADEYPDLAAGDHFAGMPG